MEHQFFKDRLSAYFDNELKHEEHAIVHQHIKGCNECQAELKQLEKLETLFAEKSELSDNDYWETSAQKIESALAPSAKTEIVEISKPNSKGLWWKLTGVAASLVLVALFAFEEQDKSDELLQDNNSNKIVESFATTPKEKSVDSFKQDDNEVLNQTIKAEELLDEISQPVDERDELKEKIVLETKETVGKLSPKQKPVKVKKEIKSIDVKSEGVEITDQQPVVRKSQTKKRLEKPPVASEEVTEDAEYIGKTINPESETAVVRKKMKPSQGLSTTSQVPTTANNDEYDKTAPQRSFGKAYEIEYWRRKVTEYSEQLKKQKNKKVEYIKKMNASDKTTSEVSLIDIEYTYSQLFKAYFKIALVTPDTAEEQQAVQFLKKHADSLGFKSSTKALYFLELYKSEKIRLKAMSEQNE